MTDSQIPDETQINQIPKLKSKIPKVKTFDASTELNYSPRKARLVINTIRGVTLPVAIQRLATNSRPKSKKIFHLLKTAANNLKLTPADYPGYQIDTIVAEEAQRLYRSVARSRGTAHKIARRYSRIKVSLMPTYSKFQEIIKEMQNDPAIENDILENNAVDPIVSK